MTGMKKFMERRTHRRFKVQEEAYAALNNGSLKIGQIQNISKGGLAFRYLANEKQSEGSYKAYIFKTDNDFFIENLLFNTISDVHIDLEIPSGTVSKRQCRGQFGELTQSQMLQLDYFIKDYTVSEA